MLSLKELQHHFQRYLMTSSCEIIYPEIAEDTVFSAADRLQVYHDSYRIRLEEILKLDFPKTHLLLGDDDFRHAFMHYLSQFPSHHFSVRYFGQYFKDFLAVTKQYQEFPILAEMAQFEWAIAFTLDAANAPIITTETLRKITPEKWPDLRFSLHPSVNSHIFNWDAPQLWQEMDEEQAPRAPIKQAKPIRWIFWRQGIKSYFQSCTPLEAKMFEALVQDAPFAELCENLLDEEIPEENIAAVAAQTLAKWVNSEMVSKAY